MSGDNKGQGRGIVKGARRLVPLLVVLAAGAGVVGLWEYYPKPIREAPPVQRPAVRVKTELVAPVPEVRDTFELPAVVEANRVVNMAAEEPGRIVRLAKRNGRDIDEGDRVSAGEAIMFLDKDLIQAEYDRAKAQMLLDAKEYERIAELRQRDVATESELDQARTRMRVSNAAFEAAQTRLDRTTIHAAISGTLDELPKEVGEYANVGDSVARIVDVEKVKVAMDVPERDVAFLKAGASQEVLAEVKGVSRAFTGPITYISELADQATRTSRVEITLDNTERLLRTGQIVRVRLMRRIIRDAIMIPLAAVIPLEEGRAVYVSNSGLAKRRDVVLGIIRGTSVQVVSGLEPGDRLIVAGHRFCSPGQPVEEESIPPLPGSAPAGAEGVEAGPELPAGAAGEARQRQVVQQ